MTETALTAFATFFATIGPIEAAVVFAALTPGYTRAERRMISFKACGIAALILLFFALFGQTILRQLGVGFPALQAAGGVILIMIALDMIFARPSGALAMTRPETVEAGQKRDAADRDEITVFPLATPILAGPGAMASAMLLMARADGDLAQEAAVIGALACVMALTLALFLAAQELQTWIGVTAQRVIMRVFGILLAAIAMQSLFDGVAASGIFARTN
ncbi:MAG: MarC family protein [Hyphomicrobiales bacterium]|nr:MarC family protein [Hyphomicrobiales bacterium]